MDAISNYRNLIANRYVKVVSKEGNFDIMRFAFNYINFGLLILDNIHFQYNSMMYGIMILSLAYI